MIVRVTLAIVAWTRAIIITFIKYNANADVLRCMLMLAIYALWFVAVVEFFHFAMLIHQCYVNEINRKVFTFMFFGISLRALHCILCGWVCGARCQQCHTFNDTQYDKWNEMTEKKFLKWLMKMWKNVMRKICVQQQTQLNTIHFPRMQTVSVFIRSCTWTAAIYRNNVIKIMLKNSAKKYVTLESIE